MHILCTGALIRVSSGGLGPPNWKSKRINTVYCNVLFPHNGCINKNANEKKYFQSLEKHEDLGRRKLFPRSQKKFSVGKLLWNIEIFFSKRIRVGTIHQESGSKTAHFSWSKWTYTSLQRLQGIANSMRIVLGDGPTSTEKNFNKLIPPKNIVE